MIKIRISTRGRYGLEAILDLAIHQSEGPVNLKKIAERQSISDKYLEQLFIVLKRNNLVEGLRGAQGGYVLTRDASEITVKEVLDVLEGPLAPVPCILSDRFKGCDEFEVCVTRILWKRIMDELNAVVENISVGDLVSCYRNIAAVQGKEYYI